ncbi:MAG: hypothetical protein AB1625_16215 [Acidobacteriota bacterium]
MGKDAARAGGVARRALVVLVVAVAVALGALAVIEVGRRRPDARTSGAAPAVEGRAVTPAVRRSPAAPSPTTSPTVTPSIQSSSVTLTWRPEPTATATAVAAAPARARPTETPAIPRCLGVAWTSRQGTPTQVLVEIVTENRCGRDLEPLEVWFEVSGFRQGDLVQSARGHLFDRLYRDGTGRATIALPGSADWMDTIRVVVLDPEGM